MSPLTHIRYEIARSLRNPRSLGITLALPLVIFFAVAGANRHTLVDGISFPLYFMGAMAAYGAMYAAIQPGARIALDRAQGWTRQLRITPLRTRTYIVAKVLTAYLIALVSLLALFLAGTTFGVHMTAGRWLEMGGLLLVGLAPLVVIGLALGHLLAPDSLTPAIAGIVVTFALFGGVFGPLFQSGTMLSVVKLLPSYWLVQASRVAVGGEGWSGEAWAVTAAWTAATAVVAVLAYRRDTARV
jgi:ABC-2 type transport system permease protein